MTQVNQWLTWLETAEEEESEGDDEDEGYWGMDKAICWDAMKTFFSTSFVSFDPSLNPALSRHKYFVTTVTLLFTVKSFVTSSQPSAAIAQPNATF